ncbi:MAG: NGG1p interacting factor NIF3 [Candidatus Peregrinibacteria bacterium]
MKLKKLFQVVVETGIKADPRGRKQIEKMLKKKKEQMEKAEGLEKELFDSERTWNPFPDTRIINGTGEEDITRLLVGIDMETPEILLADRLREKGEKIDAVFTHHPEGRALADLDKVMGLQVDLLAGAGVPVNQSEAFLRPRIERIWRAIHPDNLFRAERAAELLGFPMFTCHTAADNLVWQFVMKQICAKEWDELDDIIRALTDIPEYKYYAKKGNPPIIAHGEKSNRPGKVVATEFTGGTNGPEEFILAQAHAGVGTILTMHATEKSLEKAKEHHVNMIQCSHMASDAIGVNLMLDVLTKAEKKLSVFPVSGFVRIKR